MMKIETDREKEKVIGVFKFFKSFNDTQLYGSFRYLNFFAYIELL